MKSSICVMYPNGFFFLISSGNSFHAFHFYFSYRKSIFVKHFHFLLTFTGYSFSTFFSRLQRNHFRFICANCRTQNNNCKASKMSTFCFMLIHNFIEMLKSILVEFSILSQEFGRQTMANENFIDLFHKSR